MRSSTPKVANVWNRLEQRELKRVSRRISGYGPGQLPAPDQPAGTDLLPQIKHIVVLMMENHSYDNYLGMLPGRGEGFPLGPHGEPEVSSTGTARSRSRRRRRRAGTPPTCSGRTASSTGS
jgi:phospholipase C